MDTRLQAPIFRDAAGTRITKDRAIDSQILICQHPLMETPASSFKLRAKAPEGRNQLYTRVVVSVLCIALLGAFSAKAQTAASLAASGVTDIAATLHGVVNPASDSNYYHCTFEYGTDTSYGQSVSADFFEVTGTTPIAVAAEPPGLLPNTTYHYRVVMGPRSGGGYHGDDMTFTTGPSATLPIFDSVRADSIGDTAASFVVFGPSSGGSAATVSIEYGVDTNYGSVYAFPDIIPVNTWLPYPSARVIGLTPGTTYHWRFKLTNAQGSTYSEDQSFTTMTTPVLTTGAATDITSLLATFNGEVNPMQQMFEISFEYGTDTSYGGQTSSAPTYVYGTGTTAVSARVGFLRPGTTYHYRIRALASGVGVWFTGPDQVFTTPSDIAALSATNVTDLGATVSGTVDVGSSYNPLSFWFEYGTTTAYGDRTNHLSTQSDPLNPELKVVTASFFNLLPGTLYHCRINVRESYSEPVFSGSDFTFATAAPATPPTILLSGSWFTSGASSVVPTAATLQSYVRSGSSDATVTVDYGIDTNYGSQAVAPLPVAVSSFGLASIPITGLTPNTTYHYRFKATNNEGTDVGPDATFTTPCLPDVSTAPATYLGSSWVRCNGIYNPWGAAYSATIEYGTSTAYGSSAAAESSGPSMVPFIIPQSVQADLDGIAPSTTYHYRLKLSDGYGNFYYSDDATFTTLSPVEAWRQNFFNTTDGTGDRGDLANSTGDGVPNLLKYALGLDPTQHVTQLTPYPETADDGKTYLTFFFSRVSVATDLTYEVQVTGNLTGPWTTIATSSGGRPFTGLGLIREMSHSEWLSSLGGWIITIPTHPPPPPSYPGGDYSVMVRDIVPLSQSSARFMRLRVTRCRLPRP